MVTERDWKTNHAFLVIHIQELKVIIHSVQQTLVQAMLELTLMVDACSVPTILRFRLI